MLIITRKVGQTVVIQDNILVTVLGIERDRVKLAITAPEDIRVLRKEVLNRGRPPGPSPDQPPGASSGDDLSQPSSG